MSLPPASGARGRAPQEQHLAGVVVVVTSDRRSGELATALERRGAIIRHSPSLSMTAVEDDADLLDATKRVIADPPDIVVATTGVGFRGWIDAADAHGLAEVLVAVLSRARIVARGPKARGAIQAAGLNADWVAESETSAELAQFLLAEGVEGARILGQRVLHGGQRSTAIQHPRPILLGLVVGGARSVQAELQLFLLQGQHVLGLLHDALNHIILNAHRLDLRLDKARVWRGRAT